MLKLCHGCLDREAGVLATQFYPPTMEKAIERIRWYQYNNKEVYGTTGKLKKDVRCVSSDSEQEQDEVVNVRAAMRRLGNRQDASPTNTKAKRPDGSPVAESRVSRLETHIADMKTQISDLGTVLSRISSQLRERSPQWRTPRSTDRSPSPRDRGCYYCGEEGHFRKDCPLKKEQDGKNTSGKRVTFTERLNDSGPNKEA